MKKWMIAAAASALFTMPAMAAKTTVEFERDSGQKQTVTLNGDGTASTADGVALQYSYDPEAMKMCFELPDATNSCVVYAESVPEPKVGDSVRYTADDGAEGTATVVAIVE